MRYDVGIGEYIVSRNKGDEIKTYALGSCVAVVVWEKQLKIAGLIHIALPDSSINPEKGKQRPGYFVDTGMPEFIGEITKAGGNKRDLIIKLIGGSNIMDEKNTFDIGKRNVIAIKRYLWKNGLGVVKEDVGGKISRTVSILVDDGTIRASNSQRIWTL